MLALCLAVAAAGPAILHRPPALRPPPHCANGTHPAVGFVHVNKAGGTAMLAILHRSDAAAAPAQ